MFDQTGNAFNGTLHHDGWVYKVRQLEIDGCGLRTSFQSYRHKEHLDGHLVPSDVDVFYRNPELDPPKYVVGKDIFHFDTLGSSPILTFWKNRHRWDNMEMVAPTRERLIELMGIHGFNSPWLIFQDHRIFPSFLRLKPHYNKQLDGLIGDYIIQLFGARLSRTEVEAVTDKMINDTQLEECLKNHPGRTVPFTLFHIPGMGSGDLNVQAPNVLQMLYPLVNTIFFRHRKVMVCKRVYETGTPYNGTRGEQHYDLKVLVDKAAPFSDGLIDHGWDTL